MKHIINLFIFCIFSITASSQIEVTKILKPSNGECNGTIIFSFIASEIPGTLVMLPDDQSLDGGSISIDGTSYTLKNVCPGNYTFTFIDNHECKESEYVELEECENESFDFNVETEVVDCNFDTPFSIYPDFDNPTDYYFEWSTGSIEHFIEDITAGNYTVTMTDSYGCNHIVQKTVSPIDPEDYATDFEIIPTKIIAGTPPNWGVVEIDVQGSSTPVSIEWSCDDSSILADVSSDGLSAYINQTDFEADVIVTVTDIHGCKTDKIIKIQTCAVNDEGEFDIWYDPFEMKKCSDNFVGEIPINIDLSSLYVNYEIFKLNDDETWDLEQEGVVTQESSTLIFNYTMAGTYKVKVEDECGFSYEKEIELFCSGDEELDCEDIKTLMGKNSYGPSADCDQYHKMWFRLSNFHTRCTNINPYHPESYCDPSEVLIKFSDGGVYRVTTSDLELHNVEVIVESEFVEVEYFGESYYELVFEGDPDKTYTMEVANSHGCIWQQTIDVRTLQEESWVHFAGLDMINGMCVQALKVQCLTCKSVINYPDEMTYDFQYNENHPEIYDVNPKKEICKEKTIHPFKFYPDFPPDPNNPENPEGLWNISSGISPFDYGGTYKMQLGNNAYEDIVIPAGTPYVLVSPEEGLPAHNDLDPPDGQEHYNWIRCIYAAGYANSPAYPDKPIYIGYSREFLEDQIIYTFETPTILDPDCEDEWVTTSVEFCKKDVICLDDNQVIGTIADESSLIPCAFQSNNGECIVIGFCSESNDYYLDDDGEYFVFENLTCDDDLVMDCVENENNDPVVCDEDHPCPGNQFCKNDMCRDCPIFDYTDIYGNNGDCNYNIAFLANVSIFIIGVEAKVYLTDENGNEFLESTTSVSISPGNTSNQLSIGIPMDCNPYTVRVTLQYKNCDIQTFNIPATLDCGDCFNKDDNSLDNTIRNSISNDRDKEPNCILSPNPFTHSFDINSYKHLITEISIINSLGAHIKTRYYLNNHNIQIDLSNYPTGLYFIKVTFEDNSTELLKAIKI